MSRHAARCRGTPMRWRARIDPWNAYGITGLVAAALVVSLAMIPRLLDLALVDARIEAAKWIALVACGAALQLSWRRAGVKPSVLHEGPWSQVPAGSRPAGYTFFTRRNFAARPLRRDPMLKPVRIGGPNARRLLPVVSPPTTTSPERSSPRARRASRRWLLPNSFGVPDR